MPGLERLFEVYSADRLRRVAVLRRRDGLFQLQDERLRSYAAGDADNPTIEPFPLEAAIPSYTMVHETALGGIFGTAAEAEREANLLLA